MKRLLLAFLVFALTPAALYAKEFNPHNILSDHELTDYTSIGREAIQAFLEAKDSFLARYRAPDFEGAIKSAAQIIYDAAQTHKINPKYLLALMQKEQSLIERDGNPSVKNLDWATGYAVCDGCVLSDPAVAKYRGFGKQVDAGAGANRYYIENAAQFTVRVGQGAVIDGSTVTPQNQATANQYIYTPHLHGNENLWKIWNRWWSRRYPNGVVLKTPDSADLWLIRDDRRHRFASQGVFLSRGKIEEVIIVPAAELQNYEEGTAVSFPNYSLVRSENGMKFLLVDDTKRPFLTDEVFRTMGYHPDELIAASDDELAAYKNGRFISSLDLFPLGALVKSPVSADSYYVHNGTKAPVISKAIAQNYLPHQQTITIDAAQLRNFKLVAPLKYKDGSLVKSEVADTVYVISDGMKLPIPTEAAFLGMGWKWENVQTVDRLSLMIHPTGPTIALNGNN